MLVMAERVHAVAPATGVPASNAASAVGQGQRKPLTTAALAVVLTAAAGGVMWYLFGRSTAQTSAGPASQNSAPVIVHLEGFTVNLADPEDNHFLRVTMDLAVERLPPAVERDKPNSGLPMAHIRDTILAVLTTWKADPLLTAEGKLQLKKDLLEALNRENPGLGVREIYFTEFLVQR